MSRTRHLARRFRCKLVGHRPEWEAVHKGTRWGVCGYCRQVVHD